MIALPDRAISLRQPWAIIVARGFKPIENRCWNTSYRGDFLIHAAAAMTLEDYQGCESFCRAVMGDEFEFLQFPKMEAVKLGGIIGRSKVTSVIPPCSAARGVTVSDRGIARCVDHKWHMINVRKPQYGYLLEDTSELPFTKCKGMQRFFCVPASVMAELQANIEKGDDSWQE